MTVREASRGFLISLRAASRYSPRYLEGLEGSLVFLSSYAEEGQWPPVPQLTTEHLEQYLLHLQERQRWFGSRDAGSHVSQCTIATHYRRLKRFFSWLVERGHLERNPP
ncbi:MAG: phage integrase N-terminal SAM-like domain-containing protein [Chloroflexi bacterium]|nr:phage integrase N-terminal SAM-like domain-containing protein [Chloroflexota bacterium]